MCYHHSIDPAQGGIKKVRNFPLGKQETVQLEPFQRMIFVGLVHLLLRMSHFYFLFDFAPQTPYLFTNLYVTLFLARVTLTLDAQKTCAETISANVLTIRNNIADSFGNHSSSTGHNNAPNNQRVSILLFCTNSTEQPGVVKIKLKMFLLISAF